MFRVEERIRETEASITQWNISTVKVEKKGWVQTFLKVLGRSAEVPAAAFNFTLRVCLVGEKFPTVSVTSNLRTHAWSIKCS